MSKERMIDQIVQVLDRGLPSEAPAYTLILGAGASYGSVPTARQMLGAREAGVIHEHCIPAFLYHEKHKSRPKDADELAKVVAEFWKATPDTPFRRWITSPEALTGTPDPTQVAAAYKAVFDTMEIGGLNTPDEARRYLRNLTLGQPVKVRLNGTHFFLASILALQDMRDPASNVVSPYGNRRPFARTIFTTNFDPLLQVSLQLFQVLYYMTDRPEFLAPDTLSTYNHPSVHLFYAHGSVHGSFLANAGGDIAYLKDRNAEKLSAYLGQHGVIVLGYSGWDDCLLRALDKTSNFSHNLYWLYRGKSSLTEPVIDFLRSHPNAYAVEIQDGAEFMSELHGRLCPSIRYTELLNNPIPFLQRRLEQVDLQGIAAPTNANSEAPTTTASPGAPLPEPSPLPNVPPEERRMQVVKLLAESSTEFDKSLQEVSSLPSFKLRVSQAVSNGDWADVVSTCGKFAKLSSKPEEKAWALYRSGYAQLKLGNPAAAIEDYTHVIELKDAPVEYVARALNSRAFGHGKLLNTDLQIKDYTEVIKLKGVPVEQLARALNNHGLTHQTQGNYAKSLENYTSVIALKDVPAEQLAIALNNRGYAHVKGGAIDLGINDFTQVISVKNAPTDQVASALINRGIAYGKQGDKTREIQDFTAVINLKDAPIDKVTRALVNRGVAYGKQNDETSEIQDYTSVINLKDAPTDTIAKALLYRGVTHGKLGDTTREIQDYTTVIDLKDAPADQIANALVNRGIAYGKQGDTTREIQNYTTAINLKDAPTDDVAMALLYRGITHEDKKQFARALQDYSQVIKLKGAPAEQVASALFNRGAILSKQGNYADAKADYNAILNLPNCPTDQKSAATDALNVLAAVTSPNVPPKKKRAAKKATKKKRAS